MMVTRATPCDFKEAIGDANTAMHELRLAQQEHHLVRGLLIHAAVCRTASLLKEAEADLEEALSEATRTPMKMKLHEADTHLEWARLFLAQGDQCEARKSLHKAEKIAHQIRYRRRDLEIKRLWQFIEENASLLT